MGDQSLHTTDSPWQLGLSSGSDVGLHLKGLGREICHVGPPPYPCLNDTHEGGAWERATLRYPSSGNHTVTYCQVE